MSAPGGDVEYSATIEWLTPTVGLVRVHPGPDGKIGHDWEWMCVVVQDGDVAILKGAKEAPPAPIARAVKRCLSEAGMTSRRYDRFNGIPRSVTRHQ